MMEASGDGYVCGSIEVLEGLEPIRRRPGMYVGDVRSGRTLHQLLWEVVGNGIDEHVAGHARQVAVRIDDDVVTVADDGRGIPVAPHPRSGASVVEMVFTTIHAGGTFDGHRPHVHVGKSSRGVGVAAVNALSEWLEVEVRRDGRRHRMRFERGRRVTELLDGGPARDTGTTVRFKPDRTILEEPAWDIDAIREEMRTLSFLHPGATFFFERQSLWAPAGLRDMARWLAGDDPLAAAPIHVSTEGDVPVELVLAWVRTGRAAAVRTFVGQLETRRGTHRAGLLEGLAEGLRAGDERLADVSTPVANELLAPGMIAVMQVSLDHPRFGDAGRTRLDEPAAGRAVHQAVASALGHALRQDARLSAHLTPRWA